MKSNTLLYCAVAAPSGTVMQKVAKISDVCDRLWVVPLLCGLLCVQVAHAVDVKALLVGTESRANQLRNFQMEITRTDWDYGLQSEGEASSEKMVSSQHRIVSQDGRYLEDYGVTSSSSSGTHGSYKSRAVPGANGWVQMNLSTSEEGSQKYAITPGQRFEQKGGSFFDAHLGLWQPYAYRKVSQALWMDQNFAEKAKIRELADGVLELRYEPLKGNRTSLQVDPQSQSISKVIISDEKDRPLQESAVVEWVNVEGVRVPAKIISYKYRHLGTKQLVRSKRALTIKVETLAPKLSPADFELSTRGDVAVYNSEKKLRYVATEGVAPSVSSESLAAVLSPSSRPACQAKVLPTAALGTAPSVSHVAPAAEGRVGDLAGCRIAGHIVPALVCLLGAGLVLLLIRLRLCRNKR